MASRSWWPGDLPVELMEDVLLRVPWHDLRRSRVVSKAWNQMIMRLPKFVPIPKPDTCIFTAIRVEIPTSIAIPTPKATDLHPWQLLNVASGRTSRSISDAFIRVGLLRGVGGRLLLRRAIATSGGLIYAVYETSANSLWRNPRRIVCNPVCKIFHPIQAPPGGDHSIAAMVVEAATQRYRIVQIRGTSGDRSLAPGQVDLYDSQVRLWRKLCDAPASPTRCPTSCVVLDGVLYALFLDQPNRLNELFSCDLERGNQWRLINAGLPRPPRQPQRIISHTQVVAAAGRLFMVGYSGRAGEEAVLVTIWEIKLVRRPRLTLLGYLPRNRNFAGFCDAYPMTFPAVAVGCGDSIVVSTFEGRRVKWDVLRRKWHRMPHFLMPVIGFNTRHSVFVGPISHLNMRTMPPQ